MGRTVIAEATDEDKRLHQAVSEDLTLQERWPPVDGRRVGRGGKPSEKLPPRPRESKCAKRGSEVQIGRIKLWSTMGKQ